MGCLEIGKGSLYLWGGLRCCVKTGLACHSPSDSPVSPLSWGDQRQREVKEWRQEACQGRSRPDLDPWWTDSQAGDAANHIVRRCKTMSNFFRTRKNRKQNCFSLNMIPSVWCMLGQLKPSMTLSRKGFETQNLWMSSYGNTQVVG